MAGRLFEADRKAVRLFIRKRRTRANDNGNLETVSDRFRFASFSTFRSALLLHQHRFHRVLFNKTLGEGKYPPSRRLNSQLNRRSSTAHWERRHFYFLGFFFAIQAPGSDKARSASSISTLKVYNKVVMADARPLLALPLGPEETEEDQGEEPIRLATRRLLKSLCVFCICSLLRRAPIWCDLRSFVLRLLNAPKEEYILCRRNSSDLCPSQFHPAVMDVRLFISHRRGEERHVPRSPNR